LTAGRRRAKLQSDVETPSDAELALAVLRGDLDAFGGIVDRYQQRLYWVAYRMVGDHESARDLAQETFLRAYRGLAGFDRKRRFYTWAYRILTNLAIDHLRARDKHRRAALPEDLEAEGTPPVDRMVGDELRAEVWETLDELPPHYRSLLVLRDVEGLSGKEIADASGVGHGTVRWRIHRARGLFREAWERRLSRNGRTER